MPEFKFLEGFVSPFPFELKTAGASHSCAAILDTINEQMTATDSAFKSGSAVTMKLDTLLSESTKEESKKKAGRN